MKRFFDLSVSLLFILVSLPFWILISLAIIIDSSGPIFYRGNRIGKDGEGFKIYKFRTMVKEAEKMGPVITGGDDVRITRVGKYLRKMKLDEMPQLINVIKGEMSIVGPRPEDPKYVQHYTDRQKKVLSVRPGMASPAFIKYRHEEDLLSTENEESLDKVYINKILPEKLEMDLEYIENQSFIGDIFIFFEAGLSLFTNCEDVE